MHGLAELPAARVALPALSPPRQAVIALLASLLQRQRRRDARGGSRQRAEHHLLAPQNADEEDVAADAAGAQRDGAPHVIGCGGCREYELFVVVCGSSSLDVVALLVLVQVCRLARCGFSTTDAAHRLPLREESLSNAQHSHESQEPASNPAANR